MNSSADSQLARVSPLLWLSGLVSALCYALLWWLGPRYTLEIPCDQRPLLGLLSIYVVASFVYLAAIMLAIRHSSSIKLTWWIIGTSALFRCLLLPTPPLQEIDIYRYLWDGAVLAEGYDPFAHAPEAVVGKLNSGSFEEEQSLDKLAQLAAKNESLDDALHTIHYGELTTPYPPVSQAVFAVSAWITPESWSVVARLNLLKLVLTLLDLGALLCLVRILRRVGMPVGWALAYGWSPLVLKEIAGSGHLDAIAIFWTMVGALAAIEAWDLLRSSRYRRIAASASAVCIGLGIGAKLYPIVLVPLLLLKIWRSLGRMAFVQTTLVLVAVTTLAMGPMVMHRSIWPPATTANVAAPPDSDSAVAMLPPPPDELSGESDDDPADGLSAFLTTWEMNDFLFMLMVENLKTQKHRAEAQRPWFDVVPESINEQAIGLLRSVTGDQDSSNHQLAFLATRFTTLALFASLAIALAWRASSPSASSIDWLRAAFLTIAWFWLLAPTQNPWYWCWALPLIPFARGRTWLFMGLFCFAYYLRFWYECHLSGPGVHGTSYDGSRFFYYVVVYWEFAPVLLLICSEALLRQQKQRA